MATSRWKARHLVFPVMLCAMFPLATPQVSSREWLTRTLSGSPGSVEMNDGLATATFVLPSTLVVQDSILWIADAGGNSVRRLDRNTNMVSTVAGSSGTLFLEKVVVHWRKFPFATTAE